MGDDLQCDPAVISERQPSSEVPSSVGDTHSRNSRSVPRDGEPARLAQASAQPERGPSDALEVRCQETELLELLAEAPNDAEVHQALAALYAAGGRFTDLAELHARRFDALDPIAHRAERAALLRRIAELLRTEFDDDAAAFDVLLDAFREDFRDQETARDLECLARWNDRFGDLLLAANDWLRDETVAGDDRVALLTRIGRWYGDELAKPEWGLPYLEEARALAPNDLDVLRAKVRVLTAAGRIGATEPLLRRIVELDPDDTETLDALERVLLARGLAYDLVAFLEQRVRDRPLARGNALRLRTAALHAQLPGGELRALELLEDAYALAPTDVDVLRALDARCTQLRRWPRLRVVLEARIEHAVDDAERIDLLLRLARLLEQEFLDCDRAAQRLELLVELAPTTEEAWRMLERCYAKLRLWDAAVFAYERHLEGPRASDGGALDLESRIAASCAMGRILLDELDVPERALDAYMHALDLDPERTSTLEAIARVHERRSDVPRALAAMAEVVEREGDPARKVEALCRLAHAHRVRMSDGATARGFYRRALDLDPSHLPALSALREIALDADDVAEAARLLDREQRHTGAKSVRARLLVELARLRRDRLDDPRGAEHAFEEAFALDPSNDDAALAVVDGLIARCEWETVEPILERVARTSTRRPRSEQQELHVKLARTYAARSMHARALEAYRRATQLGTVELDVMRGLADSAYEAGELEEALIAQQKVLAALGGDERPAALHRLGDLHLRLGDERRARLGFERALEHHPSFLPARRSLLELDREDHAWSRVMEHEDAMLDVLEDGPERLALLREMADRWGDREPARAGDALEQVLAMEPADRRATLALLRARQASDDAEGILSAVERFFALDVDDPPRALAAFRVVESILRGRNDHRALEGAYRAMLARSLGDPFEWWHALGVLHRDHLGDPAASLEAFRAASRLRPDDSHERRAIVDLCVATDRTDLAIAELHQAIAREPLEVAHHRALYRLYARTGQLDRAYCVASVLTFLDGADVEQRACFAELRPHGVPRFSARLGRGAWLRSLAHPDLDRALAGVFETIARPARMLKRRANSERATREHRDTTTLLAAKAYFGASTVLGVDAHLFVQRDLPGAVVALPGEPVASLMGASLLAGWSAPELMFVLGKHLATLVSEHAVRAHFPSVTELEVLLAAATKVVVPTARTRAGVRAGEVARVAALLARELSPEERVRLGHVVATLTELERPTDVVRFMQCSELTAVRAGLLLCGDLSVAAKILRQEPVVPFDLSANEKVRELIRFAVSDGYADLRRALGIDVRQRMNAAREDDGDDDEPTRERKLCA